MTQAVTVNQALDQIEAWIRAWLPQYLGYFTDQEKGDRNLSTLLLPKDFGRIDDWPGTGQITDKLPMIYLIHAGRVGESVNDPEENVRIDPLAIKIAVLTGNTDEGGQPRANSLAALYDSTLLKMSIDQGQVSESVRILADGGSEPVANFGSNGQGNVGGVVLTWIVAAAVASLDPLFYGDPTGLPTDPDESVPVEHIEVAVEAA